MFRLKMINKPKLFKLKFNFIFPQIVLANMQEKEITPTKETQIVEPDRNYDGLKKVTVNKIPDEYIIPSGEIDITQNGTYNVADKAMANVNIPEKQLGTKTITKNGIYKATDDNLDGYSEVDVETSGVDINDYFKGTIEKGDYYKSGWLKSLLKFRSPLQVVGNDGSYMFYDFPLEEIPQIDTKNITTVYRMFGYCKFKIAPLIDTSNVTRLQCLFDNCTEVITIPKLNASKVNFIDEFITSNYVLTNFGGLENLGQAYETTKNANYEYYTFDLAQCHELTHESLMNVINNLYDIKTKGCNTQRLLIGSKNIAKLTAEELAAGTSKGWSIS